jgi:hypothetical protein
MGAFLWPPDLILITSGSKKGTQIYYFFLSRVPQTNPSRFASGDPMERNTRLDYWEKFLNEFLYYSIF